MPLPPQLVSRVEYISHQSQDMLKRIGYTPEAFAQVAVSAFVFNPQIADCTNASVDQAILRCVNTGLIPDGREAAIVPFKKQATFIPMVEGRIKLFYQAVPGASVRAMAVYEGDDWEYREGLYPKLDHLPRAVDKSPANLIYTYAIARLPGQHEPAYDVMDRATIDRYRAMSLSRNGGPWESHFEEMAKNAVLKRLLKRLPKSNMIPHDIPEELDRIESPQDVVEYGNQQGYETYTPPAARGELQPSSPNDFIIDGDTGQIMDDPGMVEVDMETGKVFNPNTDEVIDQLDPVTMEPVAQQQPAMAIDDSPF